MFIPSEFKIFVETDIDSISDLLKYEPPEKPPPMEILMDATRQQFSKEWIKYMYAKFKNVSGSHPRCSFGFEAESRILGSPVL